MESVLKTFSIGFLLRSLFAGVFFVISYRVTGEGLSALGRWEQSPFLAAGLAIAVLAGVTMYSLHRSICYPLLEWLLNSESAARARGKVPLISARTKFNLKLLWTIGIEPDKVREAYARHFSTWADYTHLLYTSALCIGAGSFARCIVHPTDNYTANWNLIAFAALFAAAALVSDWRLYSVREHMNCGGVLCEAAP